MANQKEQKAGLFRRLFGMNEAEQANEGRKQETPGKAGQDPASFTSTVFPDRDPAEILPGTASSEELHASAGAEGASAVLPWDRPSVEVTARQNAPKPDAGQRKEPTWEELLNKIVPPVTGSDTAAGGGKADYRMRSAPKNNKPEKLPWEIDLEQIPTQHATLSEGSEVGTSDTTDHPGPMLANDSQGDAFPQDVLQAVGLTLVELRDEAVDLTRVEPRDEAVDPLQNSDQILQTTDLPLEENEIRVEALRQEDAHEVDMPEAATDTAPRTEDKAFRERIPMQNGHAVWLVQLAGEEQAKGELDKATRLLEIAYILEPHPDVLLARARVETDLGNLLDAADSVLQSLADYPDSEEGIELLSFLAELGAGVDFKRVGALAPGSMLSSVRLARLCLAQDQLTAALDFFGGARSLGLDVDEIQAELGQLYQRMGNPAEAIKHYQRALELQGDLDTAASLFDLYLEAGSYQEAEDVAAANFKGSTDPDFGQRLARLEFLFGRSLFERDELESALDKFYASMEYGGVDARDWIIRILRLLADQSVDTAKVQEYLEAAMDIGGFERELAQRLSQSYLQAGKDAKALQLLQTLHEADPSDTKVTASLAATLQKLGELDQAVELLESLDGLLGNESREQLFNYYRAKGRFEAAKRHLEALYSQDSEGFRAGMQSLVWEQIRFRMEQGELDKAWEICRQELGSRPTPDMMGMAMKILSERVDSLIAENQTGQALEELEQGRALGLNDFDLGLKEAALYESVGNDRAALKVYESIARKAPEVWDKVKELYLKAATREYLAGNLAESRKLLEDAHNKLPANAEVRRALGVLYQETGEYALAAALAQDSMEETEIQVSTDHLNILRPHNYRRVRLG